ncbi:MAG TPA: acetyl-CoA C-acyltransferase, partial [Acidobacteria bacterium]|nr:acetyl-CoA C-acyltransferase [Acidobacteriota bacterium]
MTGGGCRAAPVGMTGGGCRAATVGMTGGGCRAATVGMTPSPPVIPTERSERRNLSRFTGPSGAPAVRRWRERSLHSASLRAAPVGMAGGGWWDAAGPLDNLAGACLESGMTSLEHEKRLHRAVLVDGCRTPFCRSGTALADMSSYDLGRAAVAALLHRSGIDPELVELLVMGTVLADPATSNLGREVVLGSGLPDSCPAYTVTVACVSSLQSALDCVRSIETGAVQVAICAGAETLSDAPIRYRKSVRKRLIASQKARGTGDYLKLLRGLRLKDLAPEPVALAEFSTGEIMGENGERLAKRLGITRRAQDEYALRSHHRAARATEQGLLARQIAPLFVRPRFEPLRADNGVRGDTTLDKLARLRPAFDRRFGTLTAGNSSYLTDGASALLLMSEEAAERHGYRPLAVVKSTAVAALDPLEELLLGPAVTIPKALEAAEIELGDAGVVEIHEAFAAQVLAVLQLLEDPEWARERLGRDEPVGTIDPERLNAWGGSLSVGHPFGATGGRLLIT